MKPHSSSVHQVRNYGHGHFARDSNLDADTVEITAIYTNDLPPTVTTGINGMALYYNFEHATSSGSSTTSIVAERWVVERRYFFGLCRERTHLHNG